MSRTRVALVIVVAAACGGGGTASKPTPPPAPSPAKTDQATVPLHIVGNRPLVDLTFHKPDGTTRTARFLVDSGGGGFLIVEPLAKELGLPTGETQSEEGETFARVTSKVEVSIDHVTLDLDPERVL